MFLVSGTGILHKNWIFNPFLIGNPCSEAGLSEIRISENQMQAKHHSLE